MAGVQLDMPTLTADLKTELAETARKLRIDVIKMLTRATCGHPGGSLGMADIFTALYFGGFVRHDPKNPQWTGRDRVVLSNGHICPILYAALAARGYFPGEWLDSLRQIDSHLQGHPAMHKTPGVEISTGSLGHGICAATGMALALRIDGGDQHVFCLTGDGELEEGLCWEGFMSAAHFKLDNITYIVDRNDAQIDGRTVDVMNIDPLDKKFEAFNFNVITAKRPQLRRNLRGAEQGAHAQGQAHGDHRQHHHGQRRKLHGKRRLQVARQSPQRRTSRHGPQRIGRVSKEVLRAPSVTRGLSIPKP